MQAQPVLRPGTTAGSLGAAPYAGAIFTSATLLFLIQPVIAKQLLPLFGGAAAVWTACMMFFQTVLLFGYLYAHWSIRNLSRPAQALTHIFLLILSLVALWLPAGTYPSPVFADHPAASAMAVLARKIGLPYFTLASTSPLLQAWYSAVERNKSAYRLFALSNFGSLLALMAYPFAMEPIFETELQFGFWRAAYFFFVVICAFVAVYSSRSHVDGAADRFSSSSTSNLKEVCIWVGFAACSSALLLAITNDLCQGIAPIPLLWIAPLAVYLITFVVCFDYGAIVRPKVYGMLVPAALTGLVAVHANPNLSVRFAVPLCLASLFVACMFCHGQLYERKPESGSLTRFYLAISLGGAIGSVFVGLVAPSLFSDYFELPVAVTACLLLALKFIFGYRPRAFLVACAAIALTLLRIFGTFSDDGAITVQVRNFYGAMAVRESTRNFGILRTLSHGGTVHGGQIVAKDQLKDPTYYYGRESGVGIALQRSAGKQRVGVVGLGVGTVAAYGHAGDSYRFYEINPLVQELANTHFTYLRDSGAAINVVLGDARLSLDSERDQHFDTLILDAFSGDSVPFHLLTREAFQLYFRHVKPDGVIAVHISNRYLDLSSVIARNAAILGRSAVRIISAPHPERAILTADWILVAADGDFLKQQVQQNIGTRLLPGTGRPWTDQYSNILSALR